MALFSLFLACEQPRTNRPNYGPRSGNQGTTVIYQGTPQSDSSYSPGVSTDTLSASSNSSTSDDSNSSSDNSPLVGISADNQNCNWSIDGSPYEFKNEVIGDYNYCRSSTFSNNFYLQVKAPATSDLCFFPIYESEQSTHYLGNASCVRVLSSNQIYNIELYKNRPGFTGFPINGLLIVKNQSYTFGSPFPAGFPIPAPDAFKTCMDHSFFYYSTYGYPDDSYCEAFNSQKIHAVISF
tara:strand:+ start:5982 stop:6695 length:714 start_codon:yes stop_codon:yes gene_type:complete